MKVKYLYPMMLAAVFFTTSAGAKENSPYIAKVLDYRPAPGQYINTMPEYESGDTQADMIAKCEEYLVGQAKGGLVCLGAYGGYIIFSFDHVLQNMQGSYDFKIYGNAFKATGYSTAGSSEPGIVMVSRDVNGNGLPDDEWYELAGSDYYKSSTLHTYELTYYKPSESAPDATYIRWTSNDSAEPEGYVQRNNFHRQSYWPGWISDNQMTFSGGRLAKNGYQDGGKYLLRFLDWGYADNQPNTDDPGFNLDWAVDKNGNPVVITFCHFIKVYTGVNQYCGDLGETSTEIMGAEDLHPNYGGTVSVEIEDDIRLMGCHNGQLQIENGGENIGAVIADLQGRTVLDFNLRQGYEAYDISMLPTGVYLLRAGAFTAKFVR